MDSLLANIFTITTGFVLAAAAALAFLVQRARYLREIRPDLRVLNLHPMRVEPPLRPDPEKAAFSFRLEFENRSAGIAEDLQIAGRIIRFTHDRKPETVHELAVLRLGFPQARLLPDQRFSVDLVATLPRDKSVPQETIRAAVQVTYTVPRDAMTIIISPRTWGRPRFTRHVQAHWTYEGQEPPHTLTTHGYSQA